MDSCFLIHMTKPNERAVKKGSLPHKNTELCRKPKAREGNSELLLGQFFLLSSFGL